VFGEDSSYDFVEIGEQSTWLQIHY
jgi:hypothetical protein